jgi:hypothetical protein
VYNRSESRKVATCTVEHSGADGGEFEKCNDFHEFGPLLTAFNLFYYLISDLFFVGQLTHRSMFLLLHNNIKPHKFWARTLTEKLY